MSHFNTIHRICSINTHILSLKVWLKSVLPLLIYSIFSGGLLGPFYGAIAVPSDTCCRCCCCCCGHRFYIVLILHCHSPGFAAVARRLRYSYSWLRLILVVVSTVATPGEWQCKIRTGGVRRLAVANGPNIF